VYGLSISVILKRFGSLTRTFISTVAIVLNAVLDTMFFGESLSVLELTTFLTIFAAIFLFTILGTSFVSMGTPSIFCVFFLSPGICVSLHTLVPFNNVFATVMQEMSGRRRTKQAQKRRKKSLALRRRDILKRKKLPNQRARFCPNTPDSKKHRAT